MNDMPSAASDTPALRTLLLTDLCDSTALIERLGDTATAALFRDHDALVLTLQQRWQGRLIDRSDGMLLIFVRPIDGLGFALDYMHGLHDLGREHEVELRARAGLHVGEVLTWRNSAEAVSIGAKPLEVEGLAKPMAARLMSLARPGQILLSAVAEPLAHRAARELGPRADRLLWKSHGRWRFKGVPNPQEIFEVGEIGLTPLRAPRSSAKAWRDIPLWRRPTALAAEAALLAAVAIGTWFLTRPQPAIAFAERDWVVVGDLHNLTGDVRLDESVQQALRISLEQSRHVNVLSDLKVRNTISRMRRDPDTEIDRRIGSEVALRDGARALILPAVSELGGRVQFSVEVVDPTTQRTVYVESASGRGIDSVLASIRDVTSSLRGRLGEELASIGRTAPSLPDVTTADIDALRAYALAQKFYNASDYRRALDMFVRARTLDDGFALAWLGEVRAQHAMVNAAAALVPLRRAQALRDRLPPREAMYLDAWAKQFDAQHEAAEAWEQLVLLYPDYLPAVSTTAHVLYDESRFADALKFAERSLVTQYELSGNSRDLKGRLLLALGRYKEAEQAFDLAVAAGRRNSLRGQAATAAAQRSFTQAEAIFAKALPENRYAYIEATTMALDQRQPAVAVERAEAALQLAVAHGGFDERMFPLLLGVAQWQSGQPALAKEQIRRASAAALMSLRRQTPGDVLDDASLALASALVALRLDDVATARRTLVQIEQQPQLRRARVIDELAAVVEAELARHDGAPERAIRRLTALIDGTERFQTRVALMKSLVAVGRDADAAAQARWLTQHRGLAYAEIECGYCLQSLNILDSNAAEAHQRDLVRRAVMKGTGEALLAGR